MAQLGVLSSGCVAWRHGVRECRHGAATLELLGLRFSGLCWRRRLLLSWICWISSQARPCSTRESAEPNQPEPCDASASWTVLQRHEPGVRRKWAQCQSPASQRRLGAGAGPGVAGSSLGSTGDRLARAPASGTDGLAAGSDWTIGAATSTALWKDLEILTGLYHILAGCSSEFTGDACTCGKAHVGDRGGDRLRCRGEGGRS